MNVTELQTGQLKTDFSFDPETHTYKLGDKRLPSVTEIIRNVYGNRSWHSDYYATKGKALHLAIHYYNEGVLDVESLDDAIQPKFGAYLKFQRYMDLKPGFSELSIYHSRLMFAGTIDAIYTMERIADYKSSLDPVAFIQLGGYAILYTSLFEKEPSTLMIVELKENENFKLHTIKKREIVIWKNAFLNTLSVYNLKQKYNI